MTTIGAGIKGFVNYCAVRADDACFTVSIAQDKAGCDESLRVAREWVSKNAAHTGVAPTELAEGTVVLRFG